MRPGIEPTFSWILVGFVSAAPQWELPGFLLLRGSVYILGEGYRDNEATVWNFKYREGVSMDFEDPENMACMVDWCSRSISIK